jgi:hypothetical protein
MVIIILIGVGAGNAVVKNASQDSGGSSNGNCAVKGNDGGMVVTMVAITATVMVEGVDSGRIPRREFVLV